jgi:hypothetical protein
MDGRMLLFDRYPNSLLVSLTNRSATRTVFRVAVGSSIFKRCRAPGTALAQKVTTEITIAETGNPEKDLMGQPVAETEVREISRMIATLRYPIHSHDSRYPLMSILYELRTLCMVINWKDALNPAVTNLST